MVSKKAFMRIVEATIATMLVLSVLIILSLPKKSTQEDLSFLLPPILEEIGESSVLREKIINYNTSEPITNENNTAILGNLSQFIKPRIKNPNLNFTTRICDMDKICSLEEYPTDGEVYAAERVISTTLGEVVFNPKKVKIFLWREV